MNKTQLKYSVVFNENRELYETKKYDFSANMVYYIKNNDVEHATKHLKGATQQLLNVIQSFEDRHKKTKSLYYKNTAIYFTYQRQKLYLSWNFYSDYLIKRTIEQLEKIGAINICVNYGELD